MATESRDVTLLVLPPDGATSWTLRFPVHLLGAGFVLWTVLTLYAGFLSARQADYWLLKADNAVMRLKMAAINEEVGKSKESLERAQEADRRLRALLDLPNRRAIIETGSGTELAAKDGAGGPAPADRLDLLRELRQLRQASESSLASFGEIETHLAAQRERLRATPIGWPAPGRVSSRYGYRFSPYGGEDADEFHPGLDIANALGTPITATAEGVVRRAGWTRGYGRMILLEHAKGYATLYGHASQLLVKPGQTVSRGQIIAKMGSTGRSTGSHVHYEVWSRGRTVDPKRFLKAP